MSDDGRATLWLQLRTLDMRAIGYKGDQMHASHYHGDTPSEAAERIYRGLEDKAQFTFLEDPIRSKLRDILWRLHSELKSTAPLHANIQLVLTELRAAIDLESVKSEPKPIAVSPNGSVRLYRRQGPLIVNGRPKRVLTNAQYDVVLPRLRPKELA